MSGHTPGPWIHVQVPSGLIQIWTADQGTCVGIVPRAGDFTNAHLLAAAPDLLAALEGLLNEDGHAFSCLAGVVASLTCTAECRTAKAAIRSARGLEDS